MHANRTAAGTLSLWFVALAAVAVSFAFIRGLNDSDLFWHLLNGERLVVTGRPVTEDIWSFTYAGGYRIPQEWMAEGAMYVLMHSVGPDVTLLVFALALPLGFAALGFALLTRGLSPRAIAVATVLPALVALPYASVRPQVLSWGLLAALLALLVVLEPGRRRWIWAVIPLFALWANVHGLYAVGLAVLGWYTLWTLLGRTSLRESRLRVCAAFAAAAVASLLTPSGFDGLLYPLRFLNAGDWGLANIPEWRSPNFHDAVQLPLLLLILALAVIGRRGVPGWLAGLSYVGIAMALLANRNAPVAAVLALPTLAIPIEAWLGHRRDRGPSRTGRLAMEVFATALVVVAAIVTSVPRANGIQLDRFPTEGANVLMALDGDARVLAEYGWGGYVSYRLHETGARVFVDGRNDMYPERVLTDYTKIRDAENGWQELTASYGVDALLFPPNRPLVRGVAQADGWCEAYRDDDQVLLLRCETPA